MTCDVRQKEVQTVCCLAALVPICFTPVFYLTQSLCLKSDGVTVETDTPDITCLILCYL